MTWCDITNAEHVPLMLENVQISSQDLFHLKKMFKWSSRTFCYIIQISVIEKIEFVLWNINSYKLECKYIEHGGHDKVLWPDKFVLCKLSVIH